MSRVLLVVMDFIHRETRQRGFEYVGKGCIAWKQQSWLSTWLTCPFFMSNATWCLTGHIFHWKQEKGQTMQKHYIRIAVVNAGKGKCNVYECLTGLLAWPGRKGKASGERTWL